MKEIVQKSINFSNFTLDQDSGEFEGILSAYDVVDSYGEIVQKGAFSKHLKEHPGKRPLLYEHNRTSIIGSFIATSDDKALRIKGKFDIGEMNGHPISPLARQVWLQGKEGAHLSLSWSGPIHKAYRNRHGTRVLTEIEVSEGSVTFFPANPGAVITSIKSQQEQDHSMPPPHSTEPGHKIEPMLMFMHALGISLKAREEI